MTINAATVRALKAAGVSDSQILDAIIKADEERMARARDGNRTRQAAHRARHGNNAVTPVTVVTDDEQNKIPPDPLKQNNSPKEKPPKGGQKKGARLPDDWQPEDADRDYGVKLGFSNSEIDGMAEDLRLWASAAAGPAATKRNWGSAFKGWMRREARKRPQNGGKLALVSSTPEDRSAAAAKNGKRYLTDESAEWPDAAERYKAEHGKYPPRDKVGGWYFPESYFAKEHAA